MSQKLTVFDVLKQLFPVEQGKNKPSYYTWGIDVDPTALKQLGPYAHLPLVPFDMFAVAAYLLEKSGAYHHIGPRLEGVHSFSAGTAREQAKRLVLVSQEQIASCQKIAATWRMPFAQTMTKITTEKYQKKRIDRFRKLKSLGLEAKWHELFATYGNCEIFKGGAKPDEQPPAWWAIAHELLVIADEACVDCGFKSLFGHEEPPWFEQFVLGSIYSEKLVVEDDGNLRIPGVKSLSSADPDVVCVLPKARTTPVGCTLRSLSHYLALLPPQSKARGRWYYPASDPIVSDNVELNFLLVPFPYCIPDHAFRGVVTNSDPAFKWGYFDVDQTWLSSRNALHMADRLVDLVAELVVAAKSAPNFAKSIDAILFPELALNAEIYTELSKQLKQRLPDLELLIAGISGNNFGRAGNFVAVTVYEKEPSEDSPYPQTVIREKHHRWKLDRSQLESYGLTSELNPKFQWWENIDLLSRRVDFTAFRRRSVLAAMICEDLARVDPCQELLRSVGPNLIVAILMDAPQLPSRWPARYATVLAEDPGCSVLTFTSRGLMQRQHTNGTPKSQKPEDRVIGLWRDDFHVGPREICCPNDAQGVWLKVWSSDTTDLSLDGRLDNNGKTWIFGKARALKVPDAAKRFADLLGDGDARSD